MKAACIFVTLLLAACGGSSEAPSEATPTTLAPLVPTTVAPTIPPPDRSKLTTEPPDAAERAALLGLLRDASVDKRIWFVAADRSNALLASVESAFREAGWQASTQIDPEIPIKEGDIRILVAGDTITPEAMLIRRALEAGGLRIATATGYRAYYEERTRRNPTWPTVPLGAEQAFVVVIPPPSAA